MEVNIEKHTRRIIICRSIRRNLKLYQPLPKLPYALHQRIIILKMVRLLGETGTGYFEVDTYCHDDVPANEALTFATAGVVTN